MEYQHHFLDDQMSLDAEKRPRAPILPPCRVCGSRASGFHYGVNTCEACKGFFRRSFTREVEYKCTSNNDCPILPHRRNNCSACRLRKCYETGMSKNAIKTGRYSYEQKTKYIEEVQLIIGTQSFAPQVDTEYPSTPNDNFGDYKTSTDIKVDISSPSNLRNCGNGRNDFDEDLKAYHDATCASESSAENDYVCKKIDRPQNERYVPNDMSKHTADSTTDEENRKIVNNLLKSQELLIEDLDAFLDEIHMKKRQKEFHERVKNEMPNSMVMHSGPKNELQTKRAEQMYKVAELMDSEFRNTISFIKGIPGWKALDMEDQISLIKEGAAELWILSHCQCIDTELGVFTGEYDMTYQEAANMWSDVYVESVYKTCRKFSKLRPTKEELIVLKTIVLTFPDRCPMVDRESVEKVQWRMIGVLQYICKKNGVPFNRRLGEFINGLTFARDMTEKFKDIVKTVVCQWVILKSSHCLRSFSTASSQNVKVQLAPIGYLEQYTVNFQELRT